MKKLFFSTIVTLLSITLSFAQEASRTFNIKGFDKLDIGSAYTITVTQASNYSISVKGRQSDLDDMEADLKGSTLHIGYKDKSWFGNKHKNVYITITMPALKGVNFSGATTSKVSGFSSESLDLDLSGASSGEFKVNAKNLKVDCSGASNLTIIGDGSKIDADVSGASDFKAYEFKADVVKVEASGASSAKVSASKSLVADASGASSINYKGSPSLTKSTSGASSVHGN